MNWNRRIEWVIYIQKSNTNDLASLVQTEEGEEVHMESRKRSRWEAKSPIEG